MKKNLILLLAFSLLTACNSSAPFSSHSDSYGNVSYSGEVEVKGYAETELTTEAFCKEDCPVYNYVFFKLTDNANATLQEYLKENSGNSFLGEDRIGLGCLLSSGKIYYQNYNDKTDWDDSSIELSYDDSVKIRSSDEENPISLKLTKYTDAGGKGSEAPSCYSQFSKIEILSQF